MIWKNISSIVRLEFNTNFFKLNVVGLILLFLNIFQKQTSNFEGFDTAAWL
jgi:hypothetical protein